MRTREHVPTTSFDAPGTPDAFGAFALPVGEFLVHTHGITPIVPPAEDRAYSPQSTAYGVALAWDPLVLVIAMTYAALAPATPLFPLGAGLSHPRRGTMGAATASQAS